MSSCRSRIKRLLTGGNYTVPDIMMIIGCTERVAKYYVERFNANRVGYRPKVGGNGYHVVYTLTGEVKAEIKKPAEETG